MTSRQSGGPPAEGWPALPLASWRETQETLHRWLQIVGKISLALTPYLNEWWNIALPITPRGLTTGLMPVAGGAVQIDVDFVAHELVVSHSDGRTEMLKLGPTPVAAFYHDLLAAMAALGAPVTINPHTVEIVPVGRLDRDETHASYDADAVARWWRVMLETSLVMQRFRTSFVGKSSPIQFFWGSFDLSHTRFSGRPATPPAAWPRFMQLAEDQENYACGFWPGNTTASGLTLGEPAFYAYCFPEPPGLREAAGLPAGASFDESFGEFLLPYDVVRTSERPEETLLAFFTATYAAGAELGKWDRATLERPELTGGS